jgi:hypothetical protein
MSFFAEEMKEAQSPKEGRDYATNIFKHKAFRFGFYLNFRLQDFG